MTGPGGPGRGGGLAVIGRGVPASRPGAGRLGSRRPAGPGAGRPCGIEDTYRPTAGYARMWAGRVQSGAECSRRVSRVAGRPVRARGVSVRRRGGGRTPRRRG
ncbi:hypothetical protein CP972_20415 [Streptomyces prasinus]|uniref:Uncharacterized protein n=1 Tax=Streptomyces prasinus TaxID=67345 RepID=A0ABX6AY27_9ACTN|nr:hypothetical protein CP972_20415 [Streptomyces prasinus]